MKVHGLNLYAPLVVIAILLTAFLWSRMLRRTDDGGTVQHDVRLTIIYFAGLFGALIGAHAAFIVAEGWVHLNDWRVLLSGRSITGGLLGGYTAVELAKKLLGYRRATGDYFALLVPIALILGRIGCAWQGCCAGHECDPAWYAMIDHNGVARWPSQIVELLFNAAFLVWVILAAAFNWQRGNRFHLYLISYGLFRFSHEFFRDTPHMVGELSGYQIIALAMVILGAVRYTQRRLNASPAQRDTLAMT